MKIPLFFLLLLTLPTRAEKLARADLAKLSDPATATGEVTRLVIGTRENYSLQGYTYLNAPQRDGAAPLFVLCGEKEYMSAYKGADDYEIADPAAVFGIRENKISARIQPTLDPIRDSALLVFDAEGNEIRPFGGNNYIDPGYVFDFNGDGLLDRADSTSYRIDAAPKHEIDVFELRSFERKPETLLKVIFNWHPRSASSANEWGFECFDENGDDIPEIAFGPKSDGGKLRREMVLHYDKAAGRYLTDELPGKAHIHIMKDGETLDSIAAAGGLGYPLLEERGSGKASSLPQGEYVFKSLAGLPTEKLAGFFKGERRRNSFDGAEGSFPNRLPENLWTMPPKQAALAIAGANRTTAHRAAYQMGIDDTDGAAPPASGWLEYAWGSSGCYSYSSELFALHFGAADPVLIVFGYNTIGVVGRNPWADQPAHNSRIVKLSGKEAGFIAETLYWLDRIRTRRIVRKNESYSSWSSSGDGSASVTFFPEGGKPRLLASATDWASTSVSGKWTEDYDKTTFANLAGILIREGMPKMLGQRWDVGEELESHSLMTSTGERLAPRVDATAREKLAADYSKILEMRDATGVPDDAIVRVARAAGDEALVSLLPALIEIRGSIVPISDEEKEYDNLEKRFALDHFGEPLADDPEEHKEDYARLGKLGDELRYSPSATLREPLETAIAKLHLATDPARLEQAAKEKTAEGRWALGQLRRANPEAWVRLVAADFKKSKIEERRTIFETLAAGYPPAAADLVKGMDSKGKAALALEIASYHKEHDPAALAGDYASLIEIIRNRKEDLTRRGSAMEFLAGCELPTDIFQQFEKLLIAETRSPQKANYGYDTLGTAIDALSKLPGAEKHFDLIIEKAMGADAVLSSGFGPLLAITRGRSDRKEILARYVKKRFTSSSGMMNDVFMKALAFDLRELAPEIAGFASESPAVPDGDGADYSGGKFKNPVGERYHIAREITALWSEKDPETLARMWIAFVAAHPGNFNTESDIDKAARKLAAEHVSALPGSSRGVAVGELLKEIPVSGYYAGTVEWLGQIGESP